MKMQISTQNKSLFFFPFAFQPQKSESFPPFPKKTLFGFCRSGGGAEYQPTCFNKEKWFCFRGNRFDRKTITRQLEFTCRTERILPCEKKETLAKSLQNMHQSYLYLGVLFLDILTQDSPTYPVNLKLGIWFFP